MRQFLWSIMKLFKSWIQNYNQRMKKWQSGDDLMSPTEPQLLKLGNNKTSISLWDCSSCWVGFVSTRNKLDFSFIDKDLLYYLLVRTVTDRSLWCCLYDKCMAVMSKQTFDVYVIIISPIRFWLRKTSENMLYVVF